MKRNNPVPERSRQSPLAIILFIVQFAKNLVRQFWFVAVIIFMNPARRSEFYFLAGIAALSLVSLLASVIAYFRFYYYLTDKGFHLDQGVLRKKSVQIPFERIQSIRVEQSLIHQAFNIVKLEIDTAGSKNNELTITALDRETANEIRNYIFSKKEELQDQGEPELSLEERDVQDKGELLFQLDFVTLLKIGISQNHLRTLGIILVFFLSVANRIVELINPQIEDYVDQVQIDSLWAFLKAGAFILPFILIVSVLISVLQISLKYADFMVYKTREGLRLLSGLFTRVEQVAIRRKMQVISLETNPIRKLLGLVKVRIFQASSNELQVDESIMIPGCSKAESDLVVQEYLNPKVFDEAIFNQVDPRYRVRMFILGGCLPLAGLMGLAYYRFGSDALFLFTLLPIIAIVVHYYYKRLRYAVSSDWIIKKQGIFSKKTTALKTFKIQSVEIYRGFYQLRHGLATVIIHTAARPVTIPFVTLEQAQLLSDFLVAKVEQDRRSWM